MAQLTGLGPDSAVLEPSGGDGAFVEGLVRAGVQAGQVQVWDINPDVSVRVGMLGALFTARDSLLDAPDLPTFTHVVGNPPFLNKHSEYLRSHRDRLAVRYPEIGISDTYALFVIMALRQLRPNGQLALIVSDTFLTLAAYRRLREHLLFLTTVVSITLLGRDLFDAAVGTAVLVVRAAPAPAGHQLRIRDRRPAAAEQDRVEPGPPAGINACSSPPPGPDGQAAVAEGAAVAEQAALVRVAGAAGAGVPRAGVLGAAASGGPEWVVRQDWVAANPGSVFTVSADAQQLLELLQQCPESVGLVCDGGLGMWTRDNGRYLRVVNHPVLGTLAPVPFGQTPVAAALLSAPGSEVSTVGEPGQARSDAASGVADPGDTGDPGRADGSHRAGDQGSVDGPPRQRPGPVWRAYHKRGGDTRWWRPAEHAIAWDAASRAVYALPASGLAGRDSCGRPRAGVVVSGVSTRLAARLLTSDALWESNKCFALFPKDPAKVPVFALLAVLNSALYSRLLRVLNHTVSVQWRDVAALPWLPFTASEVCALDAAGRAAVASTRAAAMRIVQPGGGFTAAAVPPAVLAGIDAAVDAAARRVACGPVPGAEDAPR